MQKSQQSYAMRLITFILILVLIGATISGLSFRPVSGATESYSLVRQWGSPGGGNGQFALPWSVALDSSNNVYVDDRNNQRIQKFDSNSNFITKWNVGPTNQYPIDIAIDSSNNVYVAVLDNGINYVDKFTSNGTLIKKWFVAGLCCNDGQNGIAVDSSNKLYVSSNNHIFKFTSDGTFITSWGSKGTGNGQFDQIVGIAAGSSDNLYVTDRGNTRVEKFTVDGTFITSWGANCKVGGWFCGGIFRIATDSSNNVYVTDPNAQRVSKFTSDGRFITGWDAPSAFGVAVDPGGNVYISSGGYGFIQVYSPTSVNTSLQTTIMSTVDGNGATIPNGGTTLSTSIKIAFTARPGSNVIAGFECNLDNSPFSPCSTPTTLSNLAVGKHTFQVRAVDTAGNRDPTPASFSWTILTPAQAIQQLIQIKHSMHLDPTTDRTLDIRLNIALQFAQNNIKSGTCIQLTVFIKQVQGSNGHVTSTEATQLIQGAQNIQTALGCTVSENGMVASSQAPSSLNSTQSQQQPQTTRSTAANNEVISIIDATEVSIFICIFVPISIFIPKPSITTITNPTGISSC